MKMKRNTRKKDNGLLKIVLIGAAAYLLYKHFNKPALKQGIVIPGELQMTAFDDVPLQPAYNPQEDQTYIDSPINYYQVLRVNSEALSGVNRRMGGLPLTI